VRTSLSERMIEYANKHTLPDNDKMRVLAKDFDEKTKAFFGEKISVKLYLGSWARARRHWCDITGDSLL